MTLTFTKTVKPVTTKVGKQAEPNDFLAPVAELNADWDDAKDEAKESYTVTVLKTEQDKVRRQLILAGKAVERSVRQVWSEIPVPEKLPRNAHKDDKETYYTDVEFAKAHMSVTFYPIAKITRKRTAVAPAAPVEDSAALTELRNSLANAIAALDGGDEESVKLVESIQAQIDAQILSELEPEQDDTEQDDTEQPETDTAVA